MSNILLLCAHSTRSVTYLQALAKAGICPDNIVVYGRPKNRQSTSRSMELPIDFDLFFPDLTLGVFQTLEQLGWPCHKITNDNLDDSDLLMLLDELKPDLIVYSGYGGQLVPVSILHRHPVLHVHSGWLPNYRGSTTIYYQIIEERCCAASAILLDEKIDSGPILAKKKYPLPPKGMDVDYLYDSVIRADLLVSVLQQWLSDNGIWNCHLNDTQMQPYFIIHPLLKHIALLAVDQQEGRS